MSKNPRKNALLADQGLLLYDGTCPQCQAKFRVEVHDTIGMTNCPGCGGGLVVPLSKIVKMYELAQQKGPVRRGE